MCKNWEISRLPVCLAGRMGKAIGRNLMTNNHEKSDKPVVPANHRNNVRSGAADGGEERGLTKGNSNQQNAGRTQSRGPAPSALDRVRHVARRDRTAKFTALLHHVSVDRLRSCFLRLNRRAAAGVDLVTWEEYEHGLEDRLKDLHARIHRGSYRAKPSRRVYIAKTDGRQRPLGIAALEDKLVQAAVVEVMNAIYEKDFLGFSYGFRPKRHQHQALDALAYGIQRKKVNWILDADIRGFFDQIDRSWMLRFVENRIGVKRILCLIQKWLNAGVLEKGKRIASESGIPQGATISPLLANIYLHYVFDLWAHQWRKRHGTGDITMVRFADDFTVSFQNESDAHRFKCDLAERLRKFGLELHPEKTRLIEFGRYAAERRAKRGLGKPENFTFLGLKHICSVTRNGEFLLTRLTDRKRMGIKLRSVKAELRRRMHFSIPEQGAWLRSVVNGYFNYHAVPTNIKALEQFRKQVTRLWHRSLKRRSQRHRLTWERMNKIQYRWIPKARIIHPWPTVRFEVRTQGRSPVR
jgi:RNA-directed DNA polymerase